MKKVYLLFLSFCVVGAVSAQSVTIDDHFIGATLDNIADPSGTGQIGGSSNSADKAKMQKFDGTHGVANFGSITGVQLNFAQISSTQDTLSIVVWADNGGVPGDVLGSKVVTYAELANQNVGTTANGVGYNKEVTFDSPIFIPGNKTFWVGIRFPILFSSTFALYHTADGEFADASTHTMSETNASIPGNRVFEDFSSDYGVDVALAIFPIYDVNSGINDPNEQALSLGQNQPNPFQGFTRIPYVLHNTADVTFEVRDLTGKTVMSSNLGKQPAGAGEIRISSEELIPGVYFYTLTTQDGNRRTRKLTITE